MNTDLAVKMTIDNMDAFNYLPKLKALPQFSEELLNKYQHAALFDLTDSIDLLSYKIGKCFDINVVDIKQGLNRFSDEMQNKRFIDHGYYGALIVLRWYYSLIQREDWNPAYFYFPIVDSATAILLHNYYKYILMRHPYNLGLLDVRQHPLAYLLILADEIQDWNRPFYGALDMSGGHPTGFEVNISKDKLEIIYEIQKNGRKDKYITDKQNALCSVLQLDSVFKDGVVINCKYDP